MAGKTFGGVLSIYDSTYKVIGKVTDVTFPSLKADGPVDVTTHDSSGGVREFIPAGTLDWTDGSFECEETVADTGQAAVIANLGASMKFKYVSANGITRYCNAIILSVTPGPNPLNSSAKLTVALKASGVAPVS